MYLQAAGGAGYLQITVELDRVTAALPEWGKGGAVRVEIGPADRRRRRRASTDDHARRRRRVSTRCGMPARDLLAPGRYQVRVAGDRGDGARTPVTSRPPCDVPAPDALLGSAALASRRGPGTGRLFEPTADPRFRRTERLQVETPLLAADGHGDRRGC